MQQFQKYIPEEIEQSIIKFWKQQKILEKLRERNNTGKPFYFLEGPPYTSGRIHLGTAWNMALKDMFLRYKRMQGFNVWDRMGYDMHGLPTEHATEKKLNIKGPDEIKKFGVDKFVKECEQLCKENMTRMNEDFLRLGSTLDFSQPYQSITNDFIDGEWWLIKRAHEQNRLYQGLRTMHWDTVSATGVAKHELEYKNVTDNSVFIKLPLKDEQDTSLIIWTTTPWTLPFNMAVMVHPEIDYVQCKIKDATEEWIIAKSRIDYISKLTEKEFIVTKEFKGSYLKGKKYTHPFADEIPFFTEIKDNPKLHTVVLSQEYVDDTAGTGLVHTAPGCGPEDYEVGHENGLPPFNTTNEHGIMVNLGPFTGMQARKDDTEFTQQFDNKGALIASEKVQHDYPHDWRSHEPVIFRATKQWFFKVEDLKQQMIEANNNVNWVPKAGYNAFNSWLENLRDNSISKQRFWGTPLPIWVNNEDEKDYIVVGSLAELEQLSEQKITNPHKPWIDDIVIKKDGKTYNRVPDVLDVWVDAGTASWNCLYYPTKKDYFNLFPADFILEGKDQIRGWFNLLMVASFLALNKPSFKAVYMHGFVTDVDGVKMSKSLGNVIAPDEVINKYSADAFRYYASQTNAGEDMNFSWETLELKHRNLNVLWNIQRFITTLAQELNINPFKNTPEPNELPERVVLSKLNNTIKTVTKLFNTYKLDDITEPIEQLFLFISRGYIQLVREKASIGTTSEKTIVATTLAHVLLETLKLFSPIAPFITEAIYQNLKQDFNLKEESIHHYQWPKCNEKCIESSMEKDLDIAQDIISAIAYAREQIKLSVRWPLKEVVVSTNDDNTSRAVQHCATIIKTQSNVKELRVGNIDGISEHARIDFAKVNQRYGKNSPKVSAALGKQNPSVILKAINENKEYKFTIDNLNVSIKRDDLTITQDVPKPYKPAMFKTGSVYVNTQRTPELDGEGYSRELMRRVQTLRKTSGLQKPDRIILAIKSSNNLKSLLEPHQNDIKTKVGATTITVETSDPNMKHDATSEEKVKGEEFTIYITKK